eukprot:5138083-Pyramimonas_sp.AAC.1
MLSGSSTSPLAATKVDGLPPAPSTAFRAWLRCPGFSRIAPWRAQGFRLGAGGKPSTFLTAGGL